MATASYLDSGLRATLAGDCDRLAAIVDGMATNARDTEVETVVLDIQRAVDHAMQVLEEPGQTDDDCDECGAPAAAQYPSEEGDGITQCPTCGADYPPSVPIVSWTAADVADLEF